MTSKKEFYCGNIPFIRSGEIHLTETELRISEDALNHSSAKLVQVGDLLLALYGATSGDIAISKINGAINQAILCVRPYEGFNKTFSFYFWQNNNNNIIGKYLQGGQGNLSAEIVRSVKFTYPSALEQEKIASFLSLLDERIEAQRQTIEERKKQKKALLQQIFSQSLRFPEFSDEWQETTLGEVAEFKKGSPISKEQLSEHGNPVILYGELYTTYKNEVISSVYSRTELEKGTLEISRGGEVLIPSSGETAWDIAIARCIIQPGVILGGDLNILVIHENNGSFLSYQLSGRKKGEIAKIAQGSSVIHLYGKDLGKLFISLPSLEEQQKIADFLSLIDERIEVEEELLRKYEEQKRYLLRQMFV